MLFLCKRNDTQSSVREKALPSSCMLRDDVSPVPMAYIIKVCGRIGKLQFAAYFTIVIYAPSYFSWEHRLLYS